MGGCVVSCMHSKNQKTEVSNAAAGKARATPNSVEVGPEQPNCSRIRRSPSMSKLGDEEWRACNRGEFDSMLKWVSHVQSANVNRVAVSWRTILREEKGLLKGEDGKERDWTFLHMSDVQQLTYRELYGRMTAFGRGLRKVGLEPGAKVGIYEETRCDWLCACYGLWSQKMVGVTVYANLGEDALQYAIVEAQLDAIVMNARQVKHVVALCSKSNIPLPKLIYLDELPVQENSATVYAFNDVVSLGEGMKDVPIVYPAWDDMALIMYTSGTTGNPKGVVMTHGNVVTATVGYQKRLSEHLPPGSSGDDDTYVAYLPLAHILEFCVENVMITRGVRICYGNPRTLTDTSARPHGDLKEFKPSLFAGVPRIFDTVKKAVEGKLPPEGTMKRRVFNQAYAERLHAIRNGRDTPYYNEKVFANTRSILGGRVRAIVSGGAPLSGRTHEFLSVVFCCSVSQGYGLTETTSGCTVQRYFDLQPENVGGLLPNVEVKLEDVEAWTHTDPEGPKGEVCIRGPTVTQGYYKQPEKTAESFHADGWFHTGDVGHFLRDGTLKIIGRVKALAKNSHGEYIAMEALESVYVLNDLALPNGVCVVVDSMQPFICALVLTDAIKAKKFADANGIPWTGYPEVLQNEDFHVKAAQSMAKTAKDNGKKPFECVRNVRILSDEWTPENGLLTASMKLKRREVDVRYAALIQRLFS